MYSKNIKNYETDVMPSTTPEQISFLFERTAFFLQEGEKYRAQGQFEMFSNSYQRAISLIFGLSSILNPNTTSDEGVCPEGPWDDYFLRLNHLIQENAITHDSKRFDIILKNLNDISEYWKAEKEKFINNSDFSPIQGGVNSPQNYPRGSLNLSF